MRSAADGLDRRQLSSADRAGAWSRQQLRRLWWDWLRSLWAPVAVLIGFVALTCVGVQVFLPASIADYLVGGVVTAAAWFCHYTFIVTTGAAAKLAGIDAEEVTTQELHKLRRHGWRFVNHVTIEFGDVDHALVGPGGIFAIETKRRSDWPRANLAELVTQAKRGAERLRPRLGAKASAPTPLVAAWGSKARETFPEPCTIDGVVFVAGRQLTTYLRGRPATLTAEETELALTTLIDNVRRRDERIRSDGGEPPRRVASLVGDLYTALVSTLLASLAVSASVSPSIWLGIAVGAVLTCLAVLIRRMARTTPRVRAATTAIAVSSGGLSLLFPTLSVLVRFR
mgnify:CR=1 FL=1